MKRISLIALLATGLTLIHAASPANAVPPQAAAAVRLPPVISSHMVLQRDMPVPIWGAASPGMAVTVRFRGQTKETKADAKGNWFVKLDPLNPGGPDKLGVNSVTVDDVLVGDVWVGSGQSNMAMGSHYFVQNDPVLAANVAAAPYPNIRLLTSEGQWMVADAKNLSNFSGLMFSFGLPLQKAIGVPVGLMVGAASGTPSGYWLSDAAYRGDAACQAEVAKVMLTYSADKEKAEYERVLAQWNAQPESVRNRSRGASAGRAG